VHLVGFITKKSVTMHGHMNGKKILYLVLGRYRREWSRADI